VTVAIAVVGGGIGFALVGLAAGTVLGIEALLFYVSVYLAMTLAYSFYVKRVVIADAVMLELQIAEPPVGAALRSAAGAAPELGAAAAGGLGRGRRRRPDGEAAAHRRRRGWWRRCIGGEHIGARRRRLGGQS
jgi:hypothetical protein